MSGAMAGIVVVWLGVVAGVGASGLLYGAGLVLAPIVWAPVLAFLAAFVLAPRFRAWALALNPRPLVFFHLIRVVGVAFLILHGQGRLPSAFAVPAGVGDLVVAALAPGVAFCADGRTPTRRWFFLAWNIAGLADVLYAVLTAMRLRLRDPVEMAAITGFPLSLVPTFVVPMILITHFILIAQLWGRRPPA
jgi:hypothetical protein